MYKSEVTEFLNELKATHPELDKEQQTGRALLWDKKPIDLAQRAADTHARVKQTPYVYYQNI
ncbi:hypothetical protein WM40_00055 [Robbsia andropogonis]|uniref:Acetyl-CoA carboxyl transferase n=1 Tax=Robbsia andropogonis TaxID=28092 RepID=A0A0F5K4S4_9BURK|nr:DUF3460 family protein [Robbsia andropogonis]KKB65121.1 hypothetical protein WM40_00055 [Robbsia andropogonis]MCP1116496.1 DUF3460 family protein [Robbsia andropogonis]MCP1126825.1 DUF3460 family protein [Robbsia andropogonis]